jgi:hypothetical protein
MAIPCQKKFTITCIQEDRRVKIYLMMSRKLIRNLLLISAALPLSLMNE